jgi:hypothetical protein
VEKRWEFSDGRWLNVVFSWFNAGLKSEYDRVAWVEDKRAVGLTTRGPLTLPSIGVSAGY